MIKRIANNIIGAITWPIRQVPESWWVTIIKIAAGAIVLYVVFMLFSINGRAVDLAEQAKTAQLQSKRIAQANGRHIDCLADLFARYTREQKPILKADLDKCQITEDEAAGIVGAGLLSGAVDFTAPPQSEAPAPQKTPSSNNTTKLPTTKNENTTDNQTQTPAPEPLRVLGIPVCAPDPLGLISDGVCVTEQ